MQEKEKADQFIAVYLTSIETSAIAISYAIPIAKMLNKGLILLYINDSHYINKNISTKFIEEEILRIQKEISKEGIFVSYCIQKGKTSQVLKESIELLNIVCVITVLGDRSRSKNIDSPKVLLKNLERIKSAYLLVQQPLVDENVLKNIVFTVNFEKESKEKISWASYFGRFNKALIYTFYRQYKDEYLAQSTNNNIRFVEMMFKELGVTYLIQKLEQKNISNDLQLLDLIQNKTALLVTISTQGKQVFDIIRFRPEYKVVKNKYKTPVLMLNPREDIYVLCD